MVRRAEKAEQSNGKEYCVLILISDCSIVDEVETARLIVKASHLPLSIIMIGLGESEFSFMDVLDGDEVALSYRNQQCARDVKVFFAFIH